MTVIVLSLVGLVLTLGLMLVATEQARHDWEKVSHEMYETCKHWERLYKESQAIHEDDAALLVVLSRQRDQATALAKDSLELAKGYAETARQANEISRALTWYQNADVIVRKAPREMNPN